MIEICVKSLPVAVETMHGCVIQFDTFLAVAGAHTSFENDIYTGIFHVQNGKHFIKSKGNAVTKVFGKMYASTVKSTSIFQIQNRMSSCLAV